MYYFQFTINPEDKVTERKLMFTDFTVKGAIDEYL